MKIDPSVARHLEHWQRSGLISEELAAQLRAASVADTEKAAVPWVRWALVMLGGGLVLAGLILVLAENWARLHRFGKLAGWLAIYLVLLALVRRTGRVGDRPLIAEALAFVCGGWLLGGVVLVSQIYHLNSRPANGLWLWLGLALPLCWVLPWRSSTLVSFAALVTALTVEVGDADSLVFASQAAGPWIWLGLPCLAVVLVSWLPRPVFWLPRLVGLWWLFVSQLFLLVFGAAQGLDHNDLGAAWWIAGLGLAAALVLPRRVLPASWGPLDARWIVILSLLPWALLGTEYDSADGLDHVAVGVAWVVQLLVAVVLIRSGATQDRKLWVNLGFLAVLVGIVVRYFDFFGDYLRGGTMLALTGVLILFVVGALERQRRRTLAGTGGAR